MVTDHLHRCNWCRQLLIALCGEIGQKAAIGTITSVVNLVHVYQVRLRNGFGPRGRLSRHFGVPKYKAEAGSGAGGGAGGKGGSLGENRPQHDDRDNCQLTV